MRSVSKILVLGLALFGVAALVGLFFTAVPPGGNPPTNGQISLNEVAAGMKEGTVRWIVESGDSLRIGYLDKRTVMSRKDSSAPLIPQLQVYGITPEQFAAVSIVFTDPPRPVNWPAVWTLLAALTLVLFGWVALRILHRLKGAEWELRAIREELAAYGVPDSSRSPCR